MLIRFTLAVLFVMAGWVFTQPMTSAQELLESRLKNTPAAQLAEGVNQTGDPQRGALLFYQPSMNCAKCHESGESRSLGPDLAKKRDVTTQHLVDSLLNPSKTIHEGFETVVVQTEDGDTISGVLVEKDDQVLKLIRIEKPEQVEEFELDEIEWKPSQLSTMPVGLTNQLTDSQQFFDLVKYLKIIAADGPARAAQLRPANAFVSLPPLPEYENRLDHQGLIGSWNSDSLKRGETIYSLHCASCHGTVAEEGSMPTSLRFASGKFKNGNDPYAMYQTVTHGFGMMNAQRWMVPQQKYDVIHYIREHFLRENNPAQYRNIDSDYLASLPKGDTQGPKPPAGQPWLRMDYGSSLMNTIEVSRDGSNIAQKGIVVRLDEGPGGVESGQHWMMYEHDTMRVAAVWSGQFIDWNGIHFNGRHAVHPRVAGQIHFANSTGPGWGRPGDGSFVDNRVEGRDGKRYGPLARDWVHYLGMYRYGTRSIVKYSVGETEILESPGMTYLSDVPRYDRQFNLQPREQELILQVAEIGERRVEISNSDAGQVALLKGDEEGREGGEIQGDRSGRWTLDGNTFAQVADGSAFDMHEQDFTITARVKTTENGTIFCKTKNWAEWVPDGKSFFIRNGRLTYDIGWVGSVVSRRRVNDGKWHDVAMTWSVDDSEVTFYIDGKRDRVGTLKAKDEVDDHAVRIGYTNEDFPDPSYLDGELAGVQFFQRVLDEDELSDNSKLRPEALVADWRKGEKNVLADQSGNDRDAEMIASDQRPEKTDWGMWVAASNGAGEFFIEDGNLRLRIPAGDEPLRFTLSHSPIPNVDSPIPVLNSNESTLDLASLTQGGPKNYPQVIQTKMTRGEENGPFAIDVLTEPSENPWNCRVRLTGVDFLEDGDQALCTAWDGSVWHVAGISSADGVLRWKRIAAGLFQPLGIKIRDGEIFVTCRDQLVRLHDLNGDGEMDWYENFNSDHQVTEHFHEFAMGLQTDADGNFYYAKSARHALKAIVPHHGTLLKVDASGESTKILANGFRAANGVCLNPDGTFYVTDQEGHWNPKNRINWVQEGGFYGNMFGYHDVTDASDDAMDPPMCWITNSFDRSPSELMWVDSPKWGPLNGMLLNFSYGFGQIYVVPHEKIDGQVQGGMCAFPIPRLPTGVMRGRFHPQDGQLYCCGMFAWAGDQHQPGGFYRIRCTGQEVHLPVELNALDDGLRIKFSGKIDQDSAINRDNYRIRTWTIKRSARYGSNHFDEKELEVGDVRLMPDGQTVRISIENIEPTRCMEIVYSVKTQSGKKLEGRIHNTIHRLKESH